MVTVFMKSRQCTRLYFYYKCEDFSGVWLEMHAQSILLAPELDFAKRKFLGG